MKENRPILKFAATVRGFVPCRTSFFKSAQVAVLPGSP